MTLASTASPKAPAWLLPAAALGALWNVYGIYQFAGSLRNSRENLMTVGMTAAQADVYLALPAWVSLVFAVGVFGGLLGCLALAARRRMAVPVFAVSLAGYGLLFAADSWYGVFASMPSQLAILAVVVVIAAALLWATLLARQRGALR